MFYIRSVWWNASAKNDNKEARNMMDDVIPSGQGLAEPFEAAGRALLGDAAFGSSGLAFDADEYLPMLAEYDLTDEQAREMLTVVWNIMRVCVELGINRDVCGELGLNALPVLSNDAASLDSAGNPT
jgi:hypothetical protein